MPPAADFADNVVLRCAGPVLMLLALTPLRLAAGDLPRFIEPDDKTGASAAVVVGDWPLAYTTQMLPGDEHGKLPGSVEGQVESVLEKLDGRLVEAGSGLDRVVKLNIYLSRSDIAADVQRVLAKRFPSARKPAVSYVVTALPQVNADVAADAVATTALDPGRAVKQISPATTVVPAGTRIYIAGQAERGESLAEATRKSLESLRATLKFLGRGDADIVQLKAFLTPMSEADVVRREIAAFFGDRPVPPTVLVEWKSGATTPIEIELIAWGGMHNSGDAVEFLTPPGMTTSPIYSRVARVNQAQTIYVSGLYASADSALDVDPNSPEAGEREVKDVFNSLDRILKQAGSDFRHLAKATYYVSTDAASAKLNELRPRYYDPQRPPAASKAAVADVGRAGLGLTIDMIAVPAFSDENPEYGPPEFGHALTAEDAAAGWLALFDGRTTLGWKDATVENGVLSGGATTTMLCNCELRAMFVRGGTISVGGREMKVSSGQFTLKATSPDSDKVLPIRLGDGVQVKQLAVRPLGLESLFNGRDMTGWQRIDRPRIAEDRRPQWQINDGALHAIGGPGCVEYQGGRFGDMVLQLDARTRVRHANGGVFFRAIPGDFMNGYECQVFSRGEDGDPARPAVWCTGGIDDRQNARRMVSRDGHYFRMTIIARGPHIATWINGFQQVDWTDTRSPHDNPRQGLRTEPGVIQLQAHDAGTGVEFKNIAAKRW